jgi:hypothetical protein
MGTKKAKAAKSAKASSPAATPAAAAPTMNPMAMQAQSEADARQQYADKVTGDLELRAKAEAKLDPANVPDPLVRATLRNRVFSNAHNQSFGPGEDILVPQSIALTAGVGYVPPEPKTADSRAKGVKAGK